MAPLTQWNMFRSPDVAALPCVTGSMHAVTTPFRTPGFAVSLAVAIAATTAKATTTPAASSFVDGASHTDNPPWGFIPGAEFPLLGHAFSKAHQEVPQVERSTTINGYDVPDAMHPWEEQPFPPQ